MRKRDKKTQKIAKAKKKIVNIHESFSYEINGTKIKTGDYLVMSCPKRAYGIQRNLFPGLGRVAKIKYCGIDIGLHPDLAEIGFGDTCSFPKMACNRLIVYFDQYKTGEHSYGQMGMCLVNFKLASPEEVALFNI